MWPLKSSTLQIWLTNEAEDITNVGHEDNEKIDGKEEAHGDGDVTHPAEGLFREQKLQDGTADLEKDNAALSTINQQDDERNYMQAITNEPGKWIYREKDHGNGQCHCHQHSQPNTQHQGVCFTVHLQKLWLHVS